MFDTSTPAGERAARRLEVESVAWFSTVREDGTPQPIPVWFLWDDGEIVIYTIPTSQKVRNLRSDARVAFNLNSDDHGGDVVQATGTARIDEGTTPATEIPAYLQKYRSGLEGLGMSPEEFDATYSLAIRFTPERWQVW